MSFIYVGRLDELKGIKILLQAWKLMGDEAPELKVCGTGPLEEWCKEYIANNHLRKVLMLGFVSNTEAKDLMANSEALILPTQWYEGFPMTILEAYSVGTPVIASDIGNAGAVVTEGVTGYKFVVGSADDLAAAVKKCKSMPISSKDIKEYYKQKYSEEANYRILEQIYSKAV